MTRLAASLTFMTGAAQIHPLREHRLALTMAASLILHALVSQMANPFQLATEKLLPPIEVRLLPPPEPEPPPPPPAPEPPPKPVPPPPKPPVEPPKPRPQPLKPTAEPVAPMPQIVPETQPLPVVEAPVAPPAPPPPMMTTPPQPEVPPAYTVPPPPPEPPGPSPQQVNAAKGNYGEVLARAFAKHKQYPRLAQMRGWQGTARVRLEIGADGSMISTAIEESSGHDILDRQALEMVRKAAPLPQPPETLRNQAFSVIVPITFRLE